MSKLKAQRKATRQKVKDNAPQAKTAPWRTRVLNIIVPLFLILLTLAAFWEVKNFEFCSFDDDEYVADNQHVQAGVNLKGIVWAFTTPTPTIGIH